ALIYVSIAVSIVSALCLAIGVFLRRRELFGASTSSSGKAPKGHKKTRKGAGKAAADSSPAGGDTIADDTLTIPAQPVEVPGDALVYVVRGRKRYHLDNCRQLMGRQKEELTYAEAQEEGFSPCTACMPDTALAARAAVSADKGPGTTGTPERAGATTGRGDAAGSAKRRRDKTAPAASSGASKAAGSSMGVGGPSLDKPADDRDRMASTAGGGGPRGPLPPRAPYAGPGLGEDAGVEGRHGREATAGGRHSRKRDEAVETAAERPATDRAAVERASIWLPPAAGAPAPRRSGRPAEDQAVTPAEDADEVSTGPQAPPRAQADSAATAEFEAVDPPAAASHGAPDRGRNAPADARDAGTARQTSADATSPEATSPNETSPDAATPAADVAGHTGDQAAESAVETADRSAEEGTEPRGAASDARPDAGDDGPQVRILSGTKRYHRADCALIVDIGDDADDIEALPRAEATARGCTPCLVCEPDKEHARD
ncbi:hypothetical protein HKK72_31310, partial [Actinomadura sp. HBU206391]|nr:hypothetical protein [Actinomadura sp. HBU206391]